MKKLFKITNESNYLTRIVKIDNLHPMVDPKTGEPARSVQKTIIDGASIIISKDTKIGDLMLHFACESAITPKFLAANNLYEKSLSIQNSDPDPAKAGFFNKHGRVKATNFLGEPSRGFCIPLTSLTKWQENLSLDGDLDELVGVEFDTVNGELLSWKYITPVQKRHSQSRVNSKGKRNKQLKRFKRLVEEQFNFHVDTSFFERNGHKIDPYAIYSISVKRHGSSGIVAHVLTNKDTKDYGWRGYVAKILGLPIITKVYDFIFSSRKVVKNKFINKDVSPGFYGTDMWEWAKNELQNYIPKGITLYFEMFGYVPGNTTKMIQRLHDYGCAPGETKIEIYRVTYTNPDGFVYEFTPIQVQEWCKKQGLTPVKELYRGRLIDLYPDISPSEHWFENFLARIKSDSVNFFMEMDDPDCKNKVPFEGIVFRKESLDLEVYKLKTEAHYQMTSKELDSGEIDIEEYESLGEEDSEE